MALGWSRIGYKLTESDCQLSPLVNRMGIYHFLSLCMNWQESF